MNRKILILAVSTMLLLAACTRASEPAFFASFERPNRAHSGFAQIIRPASTTKANPEPNRTAQSQNEIGQERRNKKASERSVHKKSLLSDAG